MLTFIKNCIQALIPNFLLRKIRPLYHGLIAGFAAMNFGHPSDKLIVIGVTGTNGKTTTTHLIAKILEQAHYKVGLSSTINYNLGAGEQPNNFKMTMPSGWVLQKWLAAMVKHGCDYAVLEVSSEGLAQNRHVGINFDVAVFTNLTPEHIESHGGFENYKKAKGVLFASLKKHSLTAAKQKINSHIQKTIITNDDDDSAPYYKSFPADQYINYAINSIADIHATNIGYSPKGVSFQADGADYNLQLKGQFDVYNALAAIAIARCQNIHNQVCKEALEKIAVVPGRVEVIHADFFTVIVDYAYEPVEMQQLYETLSRWPYRSVIQVLGPTGGGRDQARIPTLGEMAGRFAHTIIITTDDPYDADPADLAQKMAAGAEHGGKIIDTDVFIELDRRVAIARALAQARENDLVLITGKGADQKMAVAGGKYIDWDDRQVVHEELTKLKRI